VTVNTLPRHDDDLVLQNQAPAARAADEVASRARGRETGTHTELSSVARLLNYPVRAGPFGYAWGNWRAASAMDRWRSTPLLA
jgi:hypothetical protein